MLDLKKLVRTVIPMLAVLAPLGAGCGTTEQPDADEHVGVADQELTAAQCNYFAVNGKVQICHRTASQTNPYTILKVSESACVNAHALHAGDYVAVNDPQCQGVGCLPENAPCDPTVPCCDGFSCNNGTCTPNVSDHCNPSPCQNGGSCENNASGYTCACPAGYTGTNCETETNECASSPCVHGQCLDGINAYECACDSGWTGTNCDQEQVPTCPCEALAPWQQFVATNQFEVCTNNETTVDLLNGSAGIATQYSWGFPGEPPFPAWCGAATAGSPYETLVITDQEAAACAAVIQALGGPLCDAVDPCASNPCQNGGTCTANGSSYTCECPVGTAGANCEVTCPCVTTSDTDTSGPWGAAQNSGTGGEACQSDGAGTTYVSTGDNYNNMLVLTPGYCRATVAGKPGGLYPMTATEALACGSIVDHVKTTSNLTCAAADTCPCAGTADWFPNPIYTSCQYQPRSDVGSAISVVGISVSQISISNNEGPQVIAAPDFAFCTSSLDNFFSEVTKPQFEACFALVLSLDTYGACSGCYANQCSFNDSFCYSDSPGGRICQQ